MLIRLPKYAAKSIENVPDCEQQKPSPAPFHRQTTEASAVTVEYTTEYEQDDFEEVDDISNTAILTLLG